MEEQRERLQMKMYKGGCIKGKRGNVNLKYDIWKL